MLIELLNNKNVSFMIEEKAIHILNYSFNDIINTYFNYIYLSIK
jgi:hypothetical protein